jgi:Zn-dependent M16 (insulinase) family peptidase
LSVQVAKLRADIPEEKRDGNEVKMTVLNTILFTEDGLNNATGTFVKARTLRTLKAGLSEDPESVLSKFKKLRNSLCKPENMRILVIGDIEKLETPVSVWEKFLPNDYKVCSSRILFRRSF